MAFHQTTILIVGDNADTRQVVGEVARAAGFAVQVAIDGVEALKLVRTDEIDPVVTGWLCRYRWLIAPISAWAAVILTATLFLHLANEVREGETRSFDVYCLHLAQIARASHPWLEGVMRDLSGLGSAVALVLFTIMVSGYLALAKSRQTALILICSIGTGLVAVELFKAIYGRVRPDIELAAFSESGMSFPSGHSSMAAMVFLTLGTLWAATHSEMWQRVYILSVSAVLTILVGVSRAALGVHWATDVLGGWAFGIAWAAAWLSVAKLTSTSAQGQK